MIRPVLTAVAVVALCVACGDDDDSTASSDAVRDTCNAMVQLQLVVQEAAGDANVDLSSVHVGDFNKALDRLGTMVEDVMSIGSQLDESIKSDLHDAFANLQDSVNGVPEDATLADARGDVQAARAEFKTAWDDTLKALDCPTPPTTT